MSSDSCPISDEEFEKIVKSIPFTTVSFISHPTTLPTQTQTSAQQSTSSTSPNNQQQTTLTLNDILDWKTYRNDKYGFEIKYPEYLIIETETLSSFRAQSSRFDWLNLAIHPQSLDGFKYINVSGSFSFRYNVQQDSWIPSPLDVPQEHAPHKRQIDNIVFYVVPIGDAAAVGERIFLEDPQKKFVVDLSLYRNESYRDCINPCLEHKPYSDNETINNILSTFRFIK